MRYFEIAIAVSEVLRKSIQREWGSVKRQQ